MITPTNPDHLAILRRRRQEGRCIACGVPAHGQVFCDIHKKEYSYCPQCESLISKGRNTSRICAACQRAEHQPLADYRAARRAERNPFLTRIIRLYRRGLSYAAIGEQLSLHPKAVRGIVERARRKGQWPAGLRRHRIHSNTKEQS